MTRQINLNSKTESGLTLYEWLRAKADDVMEADPEWQALQTQQHEMEAFCKSFRKTIDSLDNSWFFTQKKLYCDHYLIALILK